MFSITTRSQLLPLIGVTHCYVASWDGDERACYNTVELQCPWVLFTAAVARAARALGEAGRGASPTAGKREGISF